MTLMKLPMNNAAPTSSTTASATSATTSAARARRRPRLVPPPRALSLSTVESAGLDPCSAGAMPETSPVTSAATAATASTRASMPIVATRARLSGNAAASTRTHNQARARPTMVPADRHDEALDQHALHESTAAGAECRTHGRIALLHGRAREPEVRDVRAGDEQHDAHRGKEHEHPQPRGAADEVIAKRANADAAARVGRGIGSGDRSRRPGTSAPAPGRATHPASGARCSAIRPQSRRAPPRTRSCGLADPERPEIGWLGRTGWIGEARRHHADDRVGLAIERERAANGRGIAAEGAAARNHGSPRPRGRCRRSHCVT